jgi:hypothetical protein
MNIIIYLIQINKIKNDILNFFKHIQLYRKIITNIYTFKFIINKTIFIIKYI